MTEDDLSYEPPPVLLPCSICSRTFRPDVLDRHIKVCEKTASKKRRVFDSFKSRVSGTELEEFLGPAPLPGQAPKRPDKSPTKKSQARPKWKETHEHLIAVLRAARGAATTDPVAALAPKNSGNEQCPSCGRFFGPRAFDRHVQFCKEKTSRIKLTPSKVSQAQERLEARTKYKAPLSLKPKLTTKEKYSPMLPRKVESSETCLVSSSAKSPSVNSVNRGAKPLPARNNLGNFSRQSPTRSSERQRSISPKKPLVSSSKVTKEPQGKLATQPKIKDNLKNTEDFRPRTGAKMSTNQDKIRTSNRKISDIEDESPKSNRKYPVKLNRKSCLSSDDGNETDSLNSTAGSTRNIEKGRKKGSLPGNAGPKKGVTGKERLSSPKNSRDDGDAKCSRHNKGGLPLINDLSVNDESFGIRVAPCLQRPQLRRKSSAGRKKSRDHLNTPREIQTKDEGDKEECDKRKITLELVIPSIPQIRSSRIPKPVTKGSEVRQEENVEDGDKMDGSRGWMEDADDRNDRGRTAIIKKDNLRKWRDISEVSTNDLLQMSEDFDFISEMDDLQLKSDLDAGDSEMEEISRSTLWELTGEEFLKSDESTECKGDVSDAPPTEVNEDEFIVLHVAEPEKMGDDDMVMKMSISEPCFKTNYPDPSAMLKAMKANTDIFVFDSLPKRFRRRTSSRKRSKGPWSKKAKVIPKTLAIRERTFLANDSPVAKRRKLQEKEQVARLKITNINDYFFGIMSKVREEHKKLDMNLGVSRKETPERRKAHEGEANVRKCSGEKTSQLHQENVEGDSKDVKKSEKPCKKFEYFEIGKNVGDVERIEMVSLKETSEKEFSRGAEAEKKAKDNRKQPCEVFDDSQSKAQIREATKKCTICYSDEEFEELRQKKEDNLKQLNPKISPTLGKNAETPRFGPDFPYEDSSTPRSEVSESRRAELSAIDSLEVVKISSLDNIAEEEEQPASTERSIEIEDFIIRKPDKSSIMSKSGNCLEELFPKPPEISEVRTAESTTAVPLSYVFDSLYDLKDEENLYNLPLRKKKEKRSGLPEIEAVNTRKDKKENSMASLVQIWKTRKQLIESGTLFEAQMEKSKWQRQKNSLQIALLPLVLTQKLAEVAEQLDSSKSKDEHYDPFKQAERQMMALLSWPSTVDLKTGNEKNQSSKASKSYQPNRTTNLETSPTSAFSKYNPKDEQSPKEMKENVNQKKVQNSSGRSSESAKRKSAEYSPMYSAADDWEEIFEKHFDLNRNEMNEKMTRSVKSALDGLLKNAQNNYSSSPERENSPPRKNRNDLSESSVIDEIVYTSTPKRPGSRASNVGDGSFERSPGRKTPSASNRKNSGYGRISPPDDFTDSLGRDDRVGRKSNRNSGVSLSSLSFCSQASDTTLADEEIMLTNLEIIGVGKSTPRTSKRRFARSQSVFDERNKMLFAKTLDSHFSSSDENDMLPTINDVHGRKTAMNNPYPKTIPSRFPRSQSVMEGRCKGDGDHFEERDEVSSPDGSKNRKAKMSGDSAYSSLNRRSPRSGLQGNQQEDRLSSSGSERSLPQLAHEHALKPVSLNFENTASSKSSKKDQPYKMSKFCHECGSKYPVAVAKFCCECGVRRLII